jgi:hypothetical protein
MVTNEHHQSYLNTGLAGCNLPPLHR